MKNNLEKKYKILTVAGNLQIIFSIQTAKKKTRVLSFIIHRNLMHYLLGNFVSQDWQYEFINCTRCVRFKNTKYIIV